MFPSHPHHDVSLDFVSLSDALRVLYGRGSSWKPCGKRLCNPEDINPE